MAKVPYTDPVTGKTIMVDEKDLIGPYDHGLRGTVHKGEHNQRIAESATGRVHTEETKEKIRQSLEGGTNTDGTKAKKSESGKKAWAKRKLKSQ